MLNAKKSYDLIERIFPVGWRAVDSGAGRRAKSAFVATIIVFCIFTITLALMPSRSVFERVVDGSLIAFCIATILVLHWSRSLQIAFGFAMFACVIHLAAYFFLHGNRDGDFFFFVLMPVAAVAFLGARQSVPYLLVTLVAAALILEVDTWLPRMPHTWHVSPMNPKGWLFHSPDKYLMRFTESASFFTIAVVIYLMSHSGATALGNANKKIESLLANILPRKVAGRLLEAGEPAEHAAIVDSYEAVTILFADIVGFTRMSRNMKPEELVLLLNGLFTRFDRIATYHAVEKIKTIGDAYMAVCGLPEADERHAQRIANVALEMISATEQFNKETGYKIKLRIGINSGPVVAGVIGRNKFIYDLWGDAVNVASRMESQGHAGKIQLTEATFELLGGDYHFKPLGQIELKGHHSTSAWELADRAA